MPRLPDVDDTLETLERICSAPTAPYHEHAALRAIASELGRRGFAPEEDAYAQVHVRAARGAAKRSLALVAHTDHPGFDVVAASGTSGRARVLGGLRETFLRREVPVVVHDDTGGEAFPAMLDDFAPKVDVPNNSPGHCRIRAQRPLALGQWAVLDLPAFVRAGDELHMRAADDLALCAVIVLVLAALREEPRAHDVRAVFTRAEETGLYGARLVAEDGLLPRDAVVISLEASRALPHAPAGAGPVIRAGDVHNTFSNDGERFLRVGAERLLEIGVGTQRALLTGGTCESSTFVRLGWTTTAIAVPNTSYHNMGASSDRFVPEVLRLSDVRGAVALLVEAAAAAGADEDESWWPDVRAVPSDMREMLRKREPR